jgi:hypothetical protein
MHNHLHVHQATLDLGGRFKRPRGWSSPPATTLRRILDALWEGFAAHGEYEHLRSRGIAHDAALKHVFAHHTCDIHVDGCERRKQ